MCQPAVSCPLLTLSTTVSNVLGDRFVPPRPRDHTWLAFSMPLHCICIIDVIVWVDVVAKLLAGLREGSAL
jgi:hypothetical protein